MILGDNSWRSNFCLISSRLLNSGPVDSLVHQGYLALFLIYMFFHPSSTILSIFKPLFLIFFFYLPLSISLPWIPKDSVFLTNLILFLLWIWEWLYLVEVYIALLKKKKACLRFNLHTIQFTPLKYTIRLSKVYNAVGFFSIVTELCNHHHNLISEHFHHLKKKPCTY